MQINRGLLFWGVALVIAGLIPLGVQQGVIERDALTGIWRLWPLVLVALGVAIVLSRTPLAFVGTLLAAVVVGTAGGAALALGPGTAVACGVGEPTSEWTEGGSLSGAPSVEVSFNCGTLDIGLAPGSDWTLDARGDQPRVQTAADSLTLRTAEGVAFAVGRQVWDLRLPDGTDTIGLDVNAARTRADLTDATLSQLRSSFNAGDIHLDLAGSQVDGLNLSMNAGSLILVTDAASRLGGRLSVNAGSVELCAPADAVVVMRLDANITFAHNLDDAGLVEVTEDSWRRGEGDPDLDLRVSGNAASFNLLDEEACDR